MVEEEYSCVFRNGNLKIWVRRWNELEESGFKKWKKKIKKIYWN